MSVLTILQVPDERLRRKCEPVERFDADLRRLLADMADTRQAHGGLGLAAPQVGALVRAVSLNPGRTAGYPAMVNPEIVRHGDNRSIGDEGCLSIDMGRRFVPVRRWDTITVRFQTIDGESREAVARGMAARIIQHEIDHLDGKLIDGR